MQSGCRSLFELEVFFSGEEAGTLSGFTAPSVVNSVLLKCRKLRREDQETWDSIVGFFIEKPQCDGRLQSSKISS